MVAVGQSKFLRLQTVFKFRLQLLIFSFCFLLFLLLWGCTMFGSLCTFRLLLARNFFVGRFSFHTASQSGFVFQLRFPVDKVAYCFFKNQFLKSYLALQCLLFLLQFLGTVLVYFMPAVFVVRHSYSFFMQVVFTFSNCLRFSIHYSLCFIC